MNFKTTMKTNLSTVLFIATSIFSLPTVADDYVIHAGRLIDSVSDKSRESVSIFIKDNKIEAIEPGYASVQENQKLVDLKDHTVMPGLMDMHVHLAGQPREDGNTAISYSEGFFKNPVDFALRATQYTKATLLAGFTTVRDPGGTLSLALRDAINAGYIEGPRIFASGRPIASTGGHGDPTNGLNQELSRLKGGAGPKEGVINSPYEARQAVRQRYKDGADLIKITATGGVMSLAKSADNPQFMDDELAAIVETARDYGFTVAVHAHGAEGMKRAVEAGVDSIEHGTYMTDEIMRLMKKKGTYYVPTISAAKWVAEHADTLPEIVQPKARAVGPKLQSTFAKAYQKGVKIAFGTDAGVSPHGVNGKEFMYMVEAGMPPMEAIQSATMTPAKLLRIDDKLGSVEAGKIADLVAVKGNPLEDISLMRKVSFVMKNGLIYKHVKT